MKVKIIGLIVNKSTAKDSICPIDAIHLVSTENALLDCSAVCSIAQV